MLDLRGKLSYANVMSTIAVFAVLAGSGAYAASKIGPADIQKNAVRSKHIKKNQVKGKQVQEKSVRRDLGLVVGGHVQLDSANPPTQRVLARSGPMRLVATCASGGDGQVRISSSAGGGVIGVLYTGLNTQGFAPVERLSSSLSSGVGTQIVGGVPDFVLDQGASFTATAGNRTISGEARAQAAGFNSCSLSFNGVAG